MFRSGRFNPHRAGYEENAGGPYALDFFLPAPGGLRFLPTPEQCAAFNGLLVRVYVTPQAKQ